MAFIKLSSIRSNVSAVQGRLRGDIARTVAKEVAKAVCCLHRAGIVHGDITPANVLFRVAEGIPYWSESEVYARLGSPVLRRVREVDESPLGPHVPANVVIPVEDARLVDSAFLRESVLLTDFG
jgi:serine/threonine-protein kinase SRPK3